MIKLQRIKTADVDLYQFMENLITTAFPAEEYRALEQLREYTDKVELFHNNVILEDEQPIGLLTYWNFGEFYYIEHFATDPSMRNGGYGKKTLEYVCTQLGNPSSWKWNVLKRKWLSDASDSINAKDSNFGKTTICNPHTRKAMISSPCISWPMET